MNYSDESRMLKDMLSKTESKLYRAEAVIHGVKMELYGSFDDLDGAKRVIDKARAELARYKSGE